MQLLEVLEQLAFTIHFNHESGAGRPIMQLKLVDGQRELGTGFTLMEFEFLSNVSGLTSRSNYRDAVLVQRRDIHHHLGAERSDGDETSVAPVG